MIFVTLGSQKFQFNRLLKALDEQISSNKLSNNIFAQIGFCDYKPRNFDFTNFLNHDEFTMQLRKSDIVISHGGTGAIISSLKQEKKVIAVPRLAKYGEHVDDHQLQILEQFKDLNLIYVCMDCSKIWEAVEAVRHIKFNRYQSNTGKIIENIDKFIVSVISRNI